MRISNMFKENKELFVHKLNLTENFDVVMRSFSIKDRNVCIFFLDGFIKEELTSKLLESFIANIKESCPPTEGEFIKKYIIFGDSRLENDDDKILTSILSGCIAVFVDGYDSAVVIDFRLNVQRQDGEPDREKVVRGSKDAFIENIKTNVTLLRRRLRTACFCDELFKIGNTTKTDVALCYMSDRVDRNLVKTVRKKLQNINTDNLSMTQQTLSALLIGKTILNPFPKFRYTQRPDIATAQLLHGDIAIVVDNSPQVIILPISIFDLMEDPNDYYFPPVTGLGLRFVRYCTAIVATFLTPIWIALLSMGDNIPQSLKFIQLDEAPAVPVILQLIILEFIIDGFKLASLNSPSLMTTTLSVLGAIVIGDVAVKTGWFSAECVLYVCIETLSTFSLPSYELCYAIKYSRIFMIILTWFIGWWGIAIGAAVTLVVMICNKTLSGFKFLYPVIPFNIYEIGRRIKKMFISN